MVSDAIGPPPSAHAVEGPESAYRRWQQEGAAPRSTRGTVALWVVSLVLGGALAWQFVGRDAWNARRPNATAVSRAMATAPFGGLRRAVLQSHADELEQIGALNFNGLVSTAELRVARILTYADALRAARKDLTDAGVPIPSDDLVAAVADALVVTTRPSTVVELLRLPATREERLVALTRYLGALQYGWSPVAALDQARGIVWPQTTPLSTAPATPAESRALDARPADPIPRNGREP